MLILKYKNMYIINIHVHVYLNLFQNVFQHIDLISIDSIATRI